jgi:hypothetical protein
VTNDSKREQDVDEAAPPPIEAHVTIPVEAFEALLEDLDAPARPSKLRDLM